MASRVYSFKRTCVQNTFTANQDGNLTANGINAAQQFQLSFLPNISDWQGLYDQYKISRVSVELRPMVTEMVGTPNSGIVAPSGFYPLQTVIDYDDVVLPGTESTMLQYSTLKTTQPARVCRRSIRPKFSSVLFQSGVINAYRPSNGWIDLTYPDVPHYGLKLFMTPPPITAGVRSSLTYTMYVTYYVKFKNVR